jgi:hypothetical protein
MPGSGAIQSGLWLTESCLQVADGCPTASQYSYNPPRVRSCIQHPKVMISLGISKPGHDSALSMPNPKCFPACPDSWLYNDIDKIRIDIKLGFLKAFLSFYWKRVPWPWKWLHWNCYLMVACGWLQATILQHLFNKLFLQLINNAGCNV